MAKNKSQLKRKQKQHSHKSSKTIYTYQGYKKIKIIDNRYHSKACERYLDVIFSYEDETLWQGSIPIEYRRTGIDLSTESEINKYLETVYDYCHSSKWQQWLEEQDRFWKNKQKKETWYLFQTLKTFNWICVNCHYNNPNWARRNQ